MPQPLPPRVRLAGLVALAAGLAAGGCESLRAAKEPDATVIGSPRANAADPPGPPPVVAPGKHATRRGAYVFYHDFEVNAADPLFAELEALPERVFEELRLPPSTAVVQVFLFDAREKYEQYMKATYPTLTPRPAYFLTERRLGGRGEDLKVFTWTGERLRTDLRHELTHATLHGVLKDVPLWLDEGLAGYFEQPPGADGVNPKHLETLRRGPFAPDLARLEKLTDVADMERPEYREAWAWVHLMLRGKPEARKALHEYLAALRTNPTPGPLLPRLRDALGDPDQALADHLARIEWPPPKETTAAGR